MPIASRLWGLFTGSSPHPANNIVRSQDTLHDGSSLRHIMPTASLQGTTLDRTSLSGGPALACHIEFLPEAAGDGPAAAVYGH